MSANHKFILALLAISMAVIGAAYYASGPAAFLISALIVTMIYLLRPLVMPAGYGKNKIRVLCVAGALGLAAAWGGWAGFINDVLTALWSSPDFSSLPGWIKSLRFSEQPSPITLGFVFAVIFVVNYFMREGPIGGGHPVPLDKDFPEESFKRKLEAFCNALHRDLITADQKSNWSPEYYTELQAEVEILSSGGVTSRRRIINLQEAIRKDKSARAFLILGVPGAGKSVALRKLARDMFDEVGNSRIPIYINLREWVRADIESSLSTKFEVGELEAFVVDSLRRRGDVFTEEFVNAYFRKLWRSGRLFFIFDSFDEMSELLDADEDSEIIHSLSDVISRFIGTHPLSRGVLASRIFRRPTQAFQAEKLLEIRPLSEASISDALSRYPEFDKHLRRKLFAQRPDLIPLARNPFMMALLGTWVKAERELPSSQPQIFEGYINYRLAACAARLKRAGLTAERVKSVSVDLAWFVFKSSVFGLEAPVKLISQHFKSTEVDAVVDILDYARIARVTQGEDKSFAFVHRRFLEYFVTVKLLSSPSDAPMSHIPTDSRGRDALVLYAQLCCEEEAERIAQLCWSEINSNFADPVLRLRAIHCLRFLIDAFGARRDVVAHFEDTLSKFVLDHVVRGESLIMAKICLEATGLLSELKAVPVLTAAISGQDSWLKETAFRACRQLPRLDPKLTESIAGYVMGIPDPNFWSNRKSILLSLSLSDALKKVYGVGRLRSCNMAISIFGAILSVILAPAMAGAVLLYGVAISLVSMTVIEPLMRKARARIAQRTLDPSAVKWAISVWPSERNFLDFFVSGVRMFGGVALLVSGVVSCTRGAGGMDARLLCIWPSCENWLIEIVLAQTLAGALLIDWAKITYLTKELIQKGKIAGVLAALSAGGGVMGVTFLILHWAERYPGLVLVLKMFGFTLMGCAAAVVLARVWMQVWRGFKDARTLRTIPLPATLARDEIACIFSGFATSFGQMRFIRALERNRVTATGVWPIGFKLSVGKGESIGALARLEEKWLRLDR